MQALAVIVTVMGLLSFSRFLWDQRSTSSSSSSTVHAVRNQFGLADGTCELCNHSIDHSTNVYDAV
mgnify:CR=1 FL=1